MTIVYEVTVEITSAPDGQNALAEAELKKQAEAALVLKMSMGSTYLRTTSVVEQ